jgi:hypothetical protein
VETLASSSATAAGEVLADLLRLGYTLDVRTRIEAHDHKVGAQTITYADKLLVRADEPLTPGLRKAVQEHRDELLAAACVIRPPVEWLDFLVGRYRDGRAPPGMLAANVAAFIGLHPAHDGPRLEEIIEEAAG